MYRVYRSGIASDAAMDSETLEKMPGVGGTGRFKEKNGKNIGILEKNIGCYNFRGVFMGFVCWVFVWMSMGLCKIYVLDLCF